MLFGQDGENHHWQCHGRRQSQGVGGGGQKGFDATQLTCVDCIGLGIDQLHFGPLGQRPLLLLLLLVVVIVLMMVMVETLLLVGLLLDLGLLILPILFLHLAAAVAGGLALDGRRTGGGGIRVEGGGARLAVLGRGIVVF